MTRDNLITNQSAADGIARLLADQPNVSPAFAAAVTAAELKHAAQFHPGSVTPVAVEGEPISVRLPWPPSVNDYWGNRIVLSRGDAQSRLRCPCCRAPLSGFVTTHLSPRAKTFREGVAGVIASLGLQKTLDRVAVELTINAPDRRQRDLDNYGKGPLDALTHAHLWGDDSQVDELTFRRGHIVRGGEIHAVVRQHHGG
jgi:crossover junction endodeoxyribonuclease RusA